MRINIICSLLLFTLTGRAQNLVVNSGFERQSPKEAGVWQTVPKPCEFSNQSNFVNTSALGWRTFDSQTPDLLEWDSTGGCPIFPRPHTGNRMLGLIFYHPFQDGQFAFDYHEMIQGTLAKPLEKGKTYKISFWVYTNDSLGIRHLTKVFGAGPFTRIHDERLKPGGFRPVFCGNFGFCFSNYKIQTGEEFMQSQITFPVKPQLNHVDIVEPTGGWQKISLIFKATEICKYFLFGNFFSDAVTPINMGAEERMQLDEQNLKLSFWERKKRIGYYLFDDFSIVEDTETNIEQALLKEKTYTFQSSVLFDSGKSDLKSQSKPAIDDLAAVLSKNPSLKIEIGGHTDNVGDENFNQTLSEKRAKAVYDALVANHVADVQIIWRGYGEASPVATNDTDTGRQKNRRVECRVMN